MTNSSASTRVIRFASSGSVARSTSPSTDRTTLSPWRDSRTLKNITQTISPTPRIGSPPTAPLRDSINGLIRDLAADIRLVHHHHERARAARYAAGPSDLPPPIVAGLPDGGLWSHQVAAIEAIRHGRSVVMTTATASGKTLCYQVPIIEAVLDGGTALCIHPTKALARDQLMSLARWKIPGVVPAAFDGDCTPEERTWVRANANVMFTNPEMLHNTILPGRGRWKHFLKNVRYVVVDEMHVLRGIFGSNMAHVLRRLRRSIVTHGGVDPTFVLTSATIGNAGVLASELVGTDVEVIDSDGSPHGQRDTVVWNPMAVEGRDPLGLNTETAAMAARLVRSGLRTIVFCGSRRTTEVVADSIRSLLRSPEDVRAYRGGYLGDERREIEDLLTRGRLRCVVATTALELGVDISGLDAVVMSGYPGTVASFRQQIGRGGRNDDPSLAVLIAGENQLDQWVCTHPTELFERDAEPATINMDNTFIHIPQLGCAAYESPLGHGDASLWPGQLDEAVRQLVLSDRARMVDGENGPAVAWIGRGSPAPTIGLRSTGVGEFRIVRVDEETGDDADRRRLIGTVSEGGLYSSAHVGAIYLHQGTAWRVTGIDHAARLIEVEPDSGDTYTVPRSSKVISITATDDTTDHSSWAAHIGSVEVSTRVTGYVVRSTATHETLRRVDLDVPESVLSTRAVWLTITPEMIASADVHDRDLPGALHAVEHAMIGLLPLFTISDRWDVGGLSTVWLEDTASPTIVIHDSFPGGAGMAELTYDILRDHISATLDLLEHCPCDGGCPRCVQSPKCGNGNEPLDKDMAARLLRIMCDSTVGG